MGLLAYLLTNLYMGAGIAADVYAATLASFREFTDDDYRRRWIRRNTITHTIFPLAGMYAVVAGIAVWRPLQSALFLAGAALLGLFLWHLVREKAGFDSEEEGAPTQDKGGLWNGLIRRVEKVDPQWALVLGVSIDAINSGFAKAADTRDWPLFSLLFSFPLVGCIVGAGAWAGGQKAKWFLSFMRGRSGADMTALSQRLARLEFWALLVELFVLGYFFWRSVASAIIPFGVAEWVDRRPLAWGGAGATLVIVFAIYGQKIVKNIDHEASQSFAESEGSERVGASHP